MHIMTANGWKPLHRPCQQPVYVAGLLEQLGIPVESCEVSYRTAIARHVHLDRDHPDWIDEQTMLHAMGSK